MVLLGDEQNFKTRRIQKGRSYIKRGLDDGAWYTKDKRLQKREKKEERKSKEEKE